MDKVTRQCPQTTTFLKKKESRSRYEPRSLCLPAERLPLGQTGSQTVQLTPRAYNRYLRLQIAPGLLRTPFRNVAQVWPSGKAGKQRDLGSNPNRLSFLFKSCDRWTLSCDFVPHSYETSKWLSSLPILMQESFW